MKKGWPKGLQKESYHAIWIIIDHADIKYQKKFFPKLQVAAENGYISKSELAVLKDRILMKTGKPQMYGTQSTYAVSTDNKMIIYLWPVKTPEEAKMMSWRVREVNSPWIRIKFPEAVFVSTLTNVVRSFFLDTFLEDLDFWPLQKNSEI